MRCMLLRKADARSEAGEMPGQALLRAMGAYMQAMTDAGVLLGGEGLKPSREGARVTIAGGQAGVVRGPFADPPGLLAGWCLIQVASLQEAIDWVKRWPPEDGAVEIEIRPVFEAEDFGAEFTPELRAAEDRMRETLARRD